MVGLCGGMMLGTCWLDRAGRKRVASEPPHQRVRDGTAESELNELNIPCTASSLSG
jgi:hypothetical protein